MLGSFLFFFKILDALADFAPICGGSHGSELGDHLLVQKAVQ